MLSRPQPARSAFHGDSLPSAIGIFAGNACTFKGKAYVVRNKEVEVSITVIVQEGTARTEPQLIAPQSGLFGYIRKRSVVVVAIKDILPVRGEKNIVKTVVVVVPDADAAG